MSSSYYFPALFIVPEFGQDDVIFNSFRVIKRKWSTSIFDLATLATKHKLNLPYQIMDIFLQRCNIEICIDNQPSFEDACDVLNAFKLNLYAQDLCPFLSPFATTHSLNQYSGINFRDSTSLREKLPDGLREGITSDEVTVEAWPYELSLRCVLRSNRRLSQGIIHKAADNMARWIKITESIPSLKSLERAAVAAPQLTAMDQSILHIWSAMEALFPRVSQEVSFRISMYISQLCSKDHERFELYNQSRDLYNLRSKIAHGAKNSVKFEEWESTWCLLMNVVKAIIGRNKMPSEDELIFELLS